MLNGGIINYSPTAEINLSTVFIPNLVVSKSSSSSISSLNPSGGDYHSSEISFSISSIC